MDFTKMMGQMKDMQARLKESMDKAQENLATITTTSEAGGGVVKAQMNGKRELIGLSIDPDLLKTENKKMVQDLVISAVNMALENIEPKIKEEMQKSTEGIVPNIPGMNMGF
jgi:DNA-binding YbaB/EbfC family protein